MSSPARKGTTIVLTNPDRTTERQRSVGAAVRRVVPTSVAVGKPDVLARMMLDTYRELDEVGQSARGNVFAGAVLLKAVAFTAATAQDIAHGLGRPYQGWMCVRAQTAAWSGYEQALPSGKPSSQYIRLITASTGTYDILVF